MPLITTLERQRQGILSEVKTSLFQDSHDDREKPHIRKQSKIKESKQNRMDLAKDSIGGKNNRMRTLVSTLATFPRKDR